MARSGRNITVDALNERRRKAVRLRIAGVSVAKAARQARLSQLTVNAAFRAYRHGGWKAVPVAPRGRGIRKPTPAPTARRSQRRGRTAEEELLRFVTGSAKNRKDTLIGRLLRNTGLRPGDQLSASAEVADQFEAALLWLGEAPLLRGRSYLLRIGGTRSAPRWRR